jgi:DNA polymerase-3 subunit alpha
MDRILAWSKEERESASDQNSLFGASIADAHDIALEPGSRAATSDHLLWEKELLGLYISGHPLEAYRHKFENADRSIRKLKETGKEKQPVVFGGVIEAVRAVTTKKGDKMVFLAISDMEDSIEAVAFPKAFEEFQDILVPENCIVVKGTMSLRNGEKSVLVDKVKILE